MNAALFRLLACAWLLASVGCAPQIGRDCRNSLDCSAQGSRLCDRTQPGGYCTIMGCEQGTCPGEAVCVKFRPQQERLAVTYCMAKCETRGDCRDDEGYYCTLSKDFGQSAEAETLGDPNQRFCAILAPKLKPKAMPTPAAMQSQDDASDSPDAAAR
jgi:hypothetical protein